MFNKRGKYILICYFSIISLLAVRLYFIQIEPSKVVQGEGQNFQSEKISQLNFSVLDVNGKNMLKYNKKYVLVVDSKPFMLNNYEDALQDLLALNFIMKSEEDSFSYTDIMADIGKHYYEITEESYDKINALKNIKGIYTYVYDQVDTKEGWKIENFIASINDDNLVQDSFQQKIRQIVAENEYPTKDLYLDDKSIYSNSTIDDGDNNKNIRLTLNVEWEDKIREVLARDDYSFLKNVGVVLLDSSTGDIRAMVQKDETAANVNLAIGDIGFEPGSIFKLITEAVALDLGKITTSDVFECKGQICTKLGEPYAHGDITVEQAIEVSCNDVFAQVGQLSTYGEMIKYTKELGLYNKVLGLAGENQEEAQGVTPKETDGISNFSIGQCVTVTPLQIAGAINAIVNDGIYIKPNLIDAIVDNNDNVITKTEKEEKRVFSSTTAKIVQNSMTNVIWNGSGYEAKVEGIVQGGKTGTSTGQGGATNHGWFAGYFEMEGKKYTLVVVAPNIGDKHPDGRELGGGNTGAPIYRDIINSLIADK